MGRYSRTTASGHLCSSVKHGRPHRRTVPGARRLQQRQGRAHEDIRPVRTITASRSAGTDSATYSGEIRARYESKLGFKVSGKVNARLVEVGSHVKPGQALLRLDPQDAVLSEASAEAQTEAARVKLAQSRIDLERGERLLADHIISKSAFDQYKLAHETAALQLRSAQAQQQLTLNQRTYNVLTADRAGVVTALDVEVGQVVSAGQPVITVAADGNREVLVSVPESRVEELRNAKTMTVTTWANPQRPYAAALRELAPDTDKATRTYAARITIREPDAAIRLGMTASVQIPNIEGGSALRVPLSAIYDNPGGGHIVDAELDRRGTVYTLQRLAKDTDADVVAVTSYVGGGSPRFYLPLDVQTPNVHLGQLMVMTRDEKARERVLEKLEGWFANDFPSVRGRVNRLENGPPVGYPVQFRVSGPDARKLQPIAERVAAILRENAHIRRVNMDAGERSKTLLVEIDQDKARALGASSKELANALQTSLSGLTITQYREGDKGIDVVARLADTERTDLNILRSARSLR